MSPLLETHTDGGLCSFVVVAVVAAAVVVVVATAAVVGSWQKDVWCVCVFVCVSLSLSASPSRNCTGKCTPQKGSPSEATKSGGGNSGSRGPQRVGDMYIHVLGDFQSLMLFLFTARHRCRPRCITIQREWGGEKRAHLHKKKGESRSAVAGLERDAQRSQSQTESGGHDMCMYVGICDFQLLRRG